MIPVEAKYADAVAMSHALFMSLGIVGQKGFTCDLAVKFWLQHSDRAMLPSLAAVLDDVNEGWIKDVGRCAQPTSHEYVRTHLQRVRSIQRRVASAACLPSGSPGAFDEEEVLSDLSDFLLREGVGSEEVVEQVLALTLGLSQARAKMSTARPTSVDPHSSTDQQYVTPLNIVAHGSDDSSSDTEHACSVGTFFITEQKRSGFKRLQCLGNCSTKPHECYSAKLLGDGCEASDFDAKCRTCFRQEMSPVTTSSSGSSSDD